MNSIGRAGLAVLFSAVVFSTAAFALGGEDVPDKANVSTLDVEYDIYLGGISLGTLTVSMRLEGDTYKAISTLQTGGVANLYRRTKIDGSSNGVIVEGHLRPVLYFASSQHGESNQQVTVTFPPTGLPSIFADPTYRDPQRIAMPDDLKVNTFDPVSAMVSFATNSDANQKKPCAMTLPVYDARRRYDLDLSYVKNTDVRMDNGLYAGPVEVCKIAYKEIAGAAQGLSKKGKIPPIYTWMTSIRSTVDPARHYLVPLRIWVESEYGVGAAVASVVKLDGSNLTKLH